MLSSATLAAAGIELFSVTTVTGGEVLEPSVMPDSTTMSPKNMSKSSLKHGLRSDDHVLI